MNRNRCGELADCREFWIALGGEGSPGLSNPLAASADPFFVLGSEEVAPISLPPLLS